MAENECTTVGVLLDLSIPETQCLPKTCSSPVFHCVIDGEENHDQEKESDAVSASDSIEIERSGDSERRHSLMLQTPVKIHTRILQDVTQKSTETNLDGSHLHISSPIVRWIDDEQFDFDIAFSPANIQNSFIEKSDENEDEVYFGPIGFAERCAASVVSGSKPEEGETKPLSPLTAAQMAELVKEATLVSIRIKAKGEMEDVDSKPTENSPDTKKRHCRSGTYTMDRSPFELLPDSVRLSLPIIDTEVVASLESGKKIENGKEEKEVNSTVQKTPNKNVVKNKENVQPSRLSKSREPRERKSLDNFKVNNTASARGRLSLGNHLGKPKNSEVAKETNKFAKSSLQRSGSLKMQKPKSGIPLNPSLGIPTARPSIPGNKMSIPSNKTSIPSNKTSIPSNKTSIPSNKTSIPSNKTSIPFNKTSIPFNKTSIPSNKSSIPSNKSSIPSNKSSIPSNKSSIPSNKSSIPSNKTIKTDISTKMPTGCKTALPACKGPLSKQSLMKPLARANPVKKNGPMKATIPVFSKKADTSVSSMKESPAAVKKIDSTTVERPSRVSAMNTSSTTTPTKQQKCFQPKQLAKNFTTPQKLSCSSVDSDTSASLTKRQSFLPTPKRHGSTGTLPPPSPLTTRSESTSSVSSVSDSSFTMPPRKGIPQRHQSIGKYSLDEVDENSPSALKPRKPRVTNTPNLPKQKLSIWSPVRKQQPINLDDAVSRCTKHTTSS